MIRKCVKRKGCDWCGKPLPPRRRRFCSNKHKDKYHNKHNPRGYGLKDIEDDFHPFDDYSLGQD